MSKIDSGAMLFLGGVVDPVAALAQNISLTKSICPTSQFCFGWCDSYGQDVARVYVSC